MRTNPDRPQRRRIQPCAVAALTAMLMLSACSATQASTADTWDAMIDERWAAISDRSEGDAKTALDEWAATACVSRSFGEKIRDRDAALTAQMTADEYAQVLAVVEHDCALLESRPDRPILAD